MKKSILLLLVMSVNCFASDYQPKAGTMGNQIFTQACIACHGENGAGKFGLFFNLTSSKLSADKMKTMIQKGGTMMPSFANIKGEELESLVSFVRSLVPAE